MLIQNSIQLPQNYFLVCLLFCKFSNVQLIKINLLIVYTDSFEKWLIPRLK